MRESASAFTDMRVDTKKKSNFLINCLVKKNQLIKAGAALKLVSGFWAVQTNWEKSEAQAKSGRKPDGREAVENLRTVHARPRIPLSKTLGLLQPLAISTMVTRGHTASLENSVCGTGCSLAKLLGIAF